MRCKNCEGELRQVYQGRRKQVDCWAHLTGSTLWCPSRETVAEPTVPPRVPRPELEEAPGV